MKTNVIFGASIICMAILTAPSCSRELIAPEEEPVEREQILTKAVVPEEFDWEKSDWMPTPPGQAQIPMPWGGQGSISAFYGADIVNDYRKQDGWRLVYSTFRDTGEELIDPYFMLYNVYRGTLRIYFYLTEPYIGESTYLQDGLVVQRASGASSNILNYLGNNIVDISANSNTFSQVQPKMQDGGSPLAGRRWYMIEYELAYDPNISNFTSDQIWLSWRLNYHNITAIEMDGNMRTDIYGTIGGQDNFLEDVLVESLKDTGKEVGEGVLSVTGLSLLDGWTEDEKTGENKLGLNKTVFKELLNGAKTAVNSLGSGIPKIAINLLSAVFGGSNSSSGSAVSLKADTSINLEGELSSQGAVSSTPIDFKIPGTEIASDASGYVPLYTDPLGVFYWSGPNTIDIQETIVWWKQIDDIMWSGYYYDVRNYTIEVKNPRDYSAGIVINPAVEEIADVTVMSQEILGKARFTGEMYSFPLIGYEYDSPWESDNPVPDIEEVCVRFVVKVQPKDGASASYICKTFHLDHNWETEWINKGIVQ